VPLTRLPVINLRCDKLTEVMIATRVRAATTDTRHCEKNA
jgi:hypothetical protein